MSEYTPEGIEFLGEHVTRYYLSGRSITVYEIRENRRQEIDIWINALLEQSEGDKPICMMYDFTAKPLLPTPYTVARMDDAMNQRPNLRGHLAVVVASSFIMTMARPFVERTIRHKQKAIEVQLFHNRTTAIQWLMDNCYSQYG